MPKIWTWVVLLACTAGMVFIVDALGGPKRLIAESGTMLSAPIPPATPEARQGSIRNALGWTHAHKRLGADMPVGKGISVGQVESPFEGGYLANTNHPQLLNTGFVPQSPSSNKSGHATSVARYAFGPDGPAPGVRVVYGWQTMHWLTRGYLNTRSIEPPKSEHDARVFNHSWISSSGGGDALVLRRVDYVIDTEDKLMVVGVANEKGAVPPLLASAYNVISVGSSTGKNSDGLTAVEGEGRAKPELVAPGGLTSWATGVVTGCVAVLLESADKLVASAPEGRNKGAAQSEVIKAVLLAGARRVDKWQPQEGESLDRALGAGVVDLDRSLVILQGGHAEPDKVTAQRYGWSFAPIKAEQTRVYRFTLDRPQGRSGFALTWHRRVLGGTVDLMNPSTEKKQKVWNSGYFIPDMDLELIRLNPDHTEARIDLSASRVDNIELIHANVLEPGRYLLKVTRAKDETGMEWDYALAWRIEAKEEPQQ